MTDGQNYDCQDRTSIGVSHGNNSLGVCEVILVYAIKAVSGEIEKYSGMLALCIGLGLGTKGRVLDVGF